MATHDSPIDDPHDAPKVVCARCSTSFPQGISDTQATGCAASVRGGKIRGHYGSTVLDGSSMDVLPGSGLEDGMDPVCDGCITALTEIGLLVGETYVGLFGDGAAVDAYDDGHSGALALPLGMDAQDILDGLFDPVETPDLGSDRQGT